MVDFLREIVSGKKKRFQEDGYNLDLTYICGRIVAMAYPASGVEQLYRNSIDKVAQFIHEKHLENFWIFNLSGRKYNYGKFANRVSEYEWQDHHSPPIETLFQICQKIDEFLKGNLSGVVFVHCLAGKGRTGTVICCYLLYCGRFSKPEDALYYYGKQRFLQDGLGVNQPCQLRYIYYFFQILTQQNIYPVAQVLKQINLHGRPHFMDDGCRPYFDIIKVRDQTKIFNSKKSDQPQFLNNNEFSFVPDKPINLCSDVLIRIQNNGTYKNALMGRISFCTAFVPENNIYIFKLCDISPEQTVEDERFPRDFRVQFIFGDLCKCSNRTKFEDKCKVCCEFLKDEKEDWGNIYQILKKYEKSSLEKCKELLFLNKFEDEIDEIMMKKPSILDFVVSAYVSDNEEESKKFQFQKQFSKTSQLSESEDSEQEGKDGKDHGQDKKPERTISLSDQEDHLRQRRMSHIHLKEIKAFRDEESRADSISSAVSPIVDEQNKCKFIPNFQANYLNQKNVDFEWDADQIHQTDSSNFHNIAIDEFTGSSKKNLPNNTVDKQQLLPEPKIQAEK